MRSLRAFLGVWRAGIAARVIMIVLFVGLINLCLAVYRVVPVLATRPSLPLPADSTITYTALGFEDIDDSALAIRILELRDSINQLHDWAPNLPVGYGPVEYRRNYQLSDTDPLANGTLFQYVDFRLECGCDPTANTFRLLRLGLDPRSLRSSVLLDQILPWSKYIPRVQSKS